MEVISCHTLSFYCICLPLSFFPLSSLSLSHISLSLSLYLSLSFLSLLPLSLLSLSLSLSLSAPPKQESKSIYHELWPLTTSLIVEPLTPTTTTTLHPSSLT